MEKSPQYLFLASGENNGEGFWIVGIKNSDENIFEDKHLLDCHRKELIGSESAKDILSAINLNINNLFNDLKNKNYLIKKPSIGIPFDIPLDLLECIFDFWFDIYKNQEAWETCLGLLKVRKRISLKNLIDSESLKGNSKKWAIKVETLHTYVPNSIFNKYIYLVGYLSKNIIVYKLKMNKPYSFSNDQLNGIVEDTYSNIIKECENLKKNTNCPNEQVVALLSVIASNFAITAEKIED